LEKEEKSLEEAKKKLADRKKMAKSREIISGTKIAFPKTEEEKNDQIELLNSLLCNLLNEDILLVEKALLVHVKTQLLLTYFVVMNIRWDYDSEGYFMDIEDDKFKLKVFLDLPVYRILFLLGLFKQICLNSIINKKYDYLLRYCIYILHNISIILSTTCIDIVLSDSDYNLLRSLQELFPYDKDSYFFYSQTFCNLKVKQIAYRLLNINLYFLNDLVELLKFRKLYDKTNLKFFDLFVSRNPNLSIDIGSLLAFKRNYIVLDKPKLFHEIYRKIFTDQFFLIDRY
ncbi:MAG: hypothetical protein ABIA74_04690, partial [bacterium]